MAEAQPAASLIAQPIDRSPTLLELYQAMAAMRAFEEACAVGITSGELRGELHLAIGQEAVAAGMLGVIRPDDWLVGTHRSHPALLAKGADPYGLLAEIYERRTGICGGKGGHLHLFSRQKRFSTTGIVGSSLPVALGHAYAASLERADYVAVGMTGDGGTNAGQFFETLNMAAIWRLPLVVVVENNGYGISVPSAEVIGGPGVVARAEALGVAAATVDGTDVEAVAEAMAKAFDHAGGGRGPALVEAVCHRFSGHYEGDPDHYRTAETKAAMLELDPLAIAARRLLERGEASQDDLDERRDAATATVLDLLDRVRADPPPDPSVAAQGVFKEAV
jgi:acetoin:2,6-dichlorophenolindophenol oxidoreductase subunit alpha